MIISQERSSNLFKFLNKSEDFCVDYAVGNNHFSIYHFRIIHGKASVSVSNTFNKYKIKYLSIDRTGSSLKSVQSISFDDFFDDLPKHVQQKVLFNLDLFV